MVSYKNIVLMMLLGLSKGGDATLRGGLTNGELNAEESTPAAAIVSKMQAFIDDADKMSYKEAEKLVEEMVEHYETREEELAEIGVNQEGIALIDVKYNELLEVLGKKVGSAEYFESDTTSSPSDITLDLCEKYRGLFTAGSISAALKDMYEKAWGMSWKELEQARQELMKDINHQDFYDCMKFTKEEEDDVEANFGKLLDEIEELESEKEVEGEKEDELESVLEVGKDITLDDCKKYRGQTTAASISAALEDMYEKAKGMTWKELEEAYQELTKEMTHYKKIIYECFQFTIEEEDDVESNMDKLLDEIKELESEKVAEGEKEGFADGDECEKYPGKVTATEVIAGLQTQFNEVDEMPHEALVELFETLSTTKEDHTTIFACYEINEEFIPEIEDDFEKLLSKVEDKLESVKEEFADGIHEKNVDITRLNDLVQSLKEKLND